MNNKLVEFNLNQRTTKEMPNFQTGDIVKVYRRIKEGGKERVQVFEGMIIAKKGGQSSSPMITVRKVSSGVGVELVLPVYSPSIDKIEVVKRAKVRRSKLYYIRDKSAKSLRLKYKDIAKFASVEDVKVEEVVAETEKVAEEMPVTEVAEVQAAEAEVVEKAPKDAGK
ncbi:MAG: 50S ribosomal protein L19 [Candidatus Moraniibacteriota bacterium]